MNFMVLLDGNLIFEIPLPWGPRLFAGPKRVQKGPGTYKNMIKILVFMKLLRINSAEYAFRKL